MSDRKTYRIVRCRALAMPAALAVLLCVSGAAAQTSDTVQVQVDRMPTFPGGEKALGEYLANTISYKEDADDSVHGTVVISFVVDSKGKVRDAKIVRGVSDHLDAGVLRVIQAMPVWEPGRKGGVPVSVQCTLPIAF